MDNKDKYPNVSESILKSIYVDNCLESVPSETVAKDLIVKMRGFLTKGGFNIRP